MNKGNKQNLSGKEMSDTAKQCLNCGYSFKKQNDLPDLSNAIHSML